MFVEANSQGRQKFAAENDTTDIRDVQCLGGFISVCWKPYFAPNLV